jgi:predicted AlkP superfamily pyrophosphatase or phosphodiesterase
MINEASVQAVNASRFTEHFGKPLYNSYCFSQIPQTIYHLLTGDGDAGLPNTVFGNLPRRYDKVVLFFVDAFGWRFFERYYEKYPFLKRFMNEGVVSKLTTQFPSTTAVHMTTMHTGLPVGETGVYEWFYYEPVVDRIIAPLMFSFAGEKGRDGMAAAGVDPRAIYPHQTLYQRLKQHQVKSYLFENRDYAPSPYGDVVEVGSQLVPFKTFPEALTNLIDAINAETGKAYFFVYFDAIDSMGHIYGPSSRQFDAEVDTFLVMMERLWHSAMSGKLDNTLLLMTADHGQTEVSPDTTIYLNQQAPSILPFVKTNRQGTPLIPAGSARDMFLYINEEHLLEAHDLLSAQLKDHAEVYYVRDLIDQGFFGPSKPSPTFMSRIADLVILPYQNGTVWWYEKGKYSQNFYGHHGGLTRNEMETVLLALPYVTT